MMRPNERGKLPGVGLVVSSREAIVRSEVIGASREYRAFDDSIGDPTGKYGEPAMRPTGRINP